MNGFMPSLRFYFYAVLLVAASGVTLWGLVWYVMISWQVSDERRRERQAHPFRK